MTDLILFGMGTVVTIVTVTAVLLVGRAEAMDSAHNRPGDERDAPLYRS